jgi:hypothetical protein
MLFNKLQLALPQYTLPAPIPSPVDAHQDGKTQAQLSPIVDSIPHMPKPAPGPVAAPVSGSVLLSLTITDCF